MEKQNKKVMVKKYFCEKSHSHKKKLVLETVKKGGYKVIKESEYVLPVKQSQPDA